MAPLLLGIQCLKLARNRARGALQSVHASHSAALQAASTPPGGTFVLGLAGRWTSALPWDAPAQVLRLAVEQQLPVPGGAVEVDKEILEYGTNYTITFIGYAAGGSHALASARAVAAKAVGESLLTLSMAVWPCLDALCIGLHRGIH